MLGPNINAPMDAEAIAPAIAAVRKAQEHSASVTAPERALIGALAQRYSPDPKAERQALDADYAAAMGEVAARFPDDDTIQVLYAEALMDLTPWDYWEPGGVTPKGRTADIVATLEKVLARSPGSSRRDPLLYSHGGSVVRSGASASPCAAARGRDARSRTSRAHAVPHLFPRRRLQGGAGGQQGRGRGRRGLYCAGRAYRHVSRCLLSPQRALADGVGADGRRRQRGGGRGREGCARDHCRRHPHHPMGAADRGRSVLCACPIQRAARPCSRLRTPATGCRS